MSERASDGGSLNDEALAELRNWLLDPRREPVLELVRKWPPGCRVTSHEDRPLLVPAPGVVGCVVSYCEDGFLGVVAPMLGELIRGECDPSSLVFLEEGDLTRAQVESILAAGRS